MTLATLPRGELREIARERLEEFATELATEIARTMEDVRHCHERGLARLEADLLQWRDRLERLERLLATLLKLEDF